MLCFFFFFISSESYPPISGKSVGSIEEKGTYKGELATNALWLHISDDFTFLLRGRPEKRSIVSLASGDKWQTQEIK